jgi:hypothetical protein
MYSPKSIDPSLRGCFLRQAADCDRPGVIACRLIGREPRGALSQLVRDPVDFRDETRQLNQ